MEKNPIMVSIWCRTYNHVDYIRDALEGFILQQTNFVYKVIIFDDASTDGTSDIVREYASKYPELFHAIIAEENTYHKSGSREKILEIWHKYLTGKYMGFCEGDDFWIDHNKLQIQVDYMEAHPECSMYMHNALWLDCKTGLMKAGDPYDGADEKNLSEEEIIMQYKAHPPTASFLFKRELIDGPEFLFETPASDYSLQLYGFAKGYVHYSNRIMSVYRSMAKGSNTNRLSINKEHTFMFYVGVLCFLIQYDKYTNYKYHNWIVLKMQEYIFAVIQIADADLNINRYFDLCTERDYFFSPICKRCLAKIESIRRQIFDMAYCDDIMKGFITKYTNIVIMGIGNYASIVTEQFKNNNINFLGYAVSHKKKDEDYFKGKPVWNLSSLPFSKEDTGIIVAIKPLRWDDILHSLETAGIKNFYCPFLLEK